VLLVSGVAHPKPFEREMRRLGIGVIDHLVYPDHYRYRAEEMARIVDRARQVGAEAVVTTAKDEVKWIAAGGPTVDPPLWVAEIGYDPRIVNLLVEALAGLCNGPSAREPIS
jgi:tetraacyldisaccharide-1-P 4'-kinase